MLPEDLHDPAAHVTIQRIVAAEHLDGMLLEVPPPLEGRRTHGDTERLGFRAAGDHAPIVVGEHHHRLAPQPRLEHRFTTRVEGVAIAEGEHGRGQRS